MSTTMNRLAELDLPEFSYMESIQHPLHSSLRITLSVTQESVGDIEIESEEVLETIIERARNGNLAAWFRATITVSSNDDSIQPHYLIIENCTAESFDDFMESDAFMEVVDDLTFDISEENQSHPAFFSNFHNRPKLAS